MSQSDIIDRRNIFTEYSRDFTNTLCDRSSIFTKLIETTFFERLIDIDEDKFELRFNAGDGEIGIDLPTLFIDIEDFV